MVRAAALVLIAGLASCAPQRDDSTRQQVAEDHIRIAEMSAQLDRQKEQIDRLDKSVGSALNLALATNKANDALTDTFNSNVRQHNEQLRRERTAAGVCGAEQVWAKDGTYVIRNKDCPAPKP